jgi:DNA polymerase-3 subunit epsilon
MLQLTRPLCSIDLETTGTDPVEDRIVEFGADILEPTGERRTWSMRFNPGIPIPPEATAAHGIRDEDVRDCPPFSEWAIRIWNGLQEKDLVGYNLQRFDLVMLDEEFRRCGLCLDLEGVKVIDCFSIFQKKEPRSLADAVRKYCGREHEGAHGAQADSSAVVDVLAGQIASYEDLGAMGIDALAEFCQDDRKYLDLARKIYLGPDGTARYAFGKHKDCPVLEHRDFVRWMKRKGTFPGSTMEALGRLLFESAPVGEQASL